MSDEARLLFPEEIETVRGHLRKAKNHGNKSLFISHASGEALLATIDASEARALAAEEAHSECAAIIDSERAHADSWKQEYNTAMDQVERLRADNARLRRLLKDLVFARHRVIPRRDKRYCEASLDTSLDTCKFCAPYYAALAEPSAEADLVNSHESGINPMTGGL